MQINPSFNEFKQASSAGNVIPVVGEVLADMETPVSAYLKIGEEPYSYLLESATGGKWWGRYSFLGLRPHLVVKAWEGRLELSRGGREETHRVEKNPVEFLRRLSREYVLAPNSALPRFQGGLVGYVNYDLIRTWERLPGIRPEDNGVPECIFTAPEQMVIFDHLTHTIQVVAFAYLESEPDLRRAYDLACSRVEETAAKLAQPMAAADNDVPVVGELQSNFSRTQFEQAVRQVKEYVVGGDVIQVVLSQRFSAPVRGNGFSLYRNLRSVNPSPYMFYLNFGEVTMIGASPEILVRLTDGLIELRPIAGTRPRGKTPAEEEALERELLADPKERAEHVMLVDLGRNDVGRVAAPGSVRVPRLMEIERYSHVMHIVSRVEGELRPGLDSFDLFMATFPAGTVTGAPKIRAMEIISELEPTPRGAYAGAVGYFGFNGNMDFCITIRTMVVQRGVLSVQVGAGIVADSSPAAEYEETMKKAEAMFEVIRRVQGHAAGNR